jgi:hypothetical protein
LQKRWRNVAELVLHPATTALLHTMLANPAQAMIISAPAGSGKQATARYLTAQLLHISLQEVSEYPYVRQIASLDNRAISIEAIRELEQFLSLRVPGRQSVSGINRAIVLADAERLSIEAQNALLKTLEEPPQGTVIMLLCSDINALLPTVRSRSQLMTLIKPSRAQVDEYFETAGFQPSAINQAYAISGGLPGLMHAILASNDHQLLPATSYARQILRGSRYDRLLLVETLSKDKPLAKNVCFILQQMSHISLQSASASAATRWLAILRASYRAAEELSTSAQPKLVLMSLMLKLS